MQEDVASTLATAFPQTLLHPKGEADCFCINRKAKDEAMQGRPFTDDDSSFTLAATAPHSVAYREDCLTPWDNQSKRVFDPEGCGPTLNHGAGMNTTPSVLVEDCYGFSAGQSWTSGSIGIQAEQSPTLRGSASGTQQAPTVCYSIAGNTVNRKVKNGGNGVGAQEDIAYTLNTVDRHAVAFQTEALPFNTTQVTSPANGNNPQWGDPCHTLAAKDHPPTVVIDRAAFNQGQNAQYSAHIEETDVMDPLVARGPHAVMHAAAVDCRNLNLAEELSGTLNAKGSGGHSLNFQNPVMCMASGQANAEIETDMAPAQAARQHKDPQIICMQESVSDSAICEDMTPPVKATQSKAPVFVCTTQYGEDLAGTLMAKADSSPCHDKGANVVANGYVVRRLTPLECERLQGFPDNWTKIPYKGKPAEDCPDTPRYKALGNSFAVPVVRWIGERLQNYVQRLEQGS